MVSKFDTMPYRDIQHGEASREAHKLSAKDIAWLCEAIEARGDNRPSHDPRVMRASELQTVFSDFVNLGGRWTRSDLSPDDVWDVPHEWGDADIVPDARDVVSCPATVAPGAPMRADDIRRAFWNAEQRELRLVGGTVVGGAGVTLDNSGVTYKQYGTPESVFRLDVTYWRMVSDPGQPAGVERGFEASGGKYKFSNPSGLPSNRKEWSINTTYAVMQSNVSTGPSSDDVHVAALKVEAEFDEDGNLSVQASAVMDLVRRMAAHYGHTLRSGSMYFYEIRGLVTVLKVADNYALSDLGWTYEP